MKIIVITMAAIAFLAARTGAMADDLQRGAHDTEVAKLLREMARVLPLRTTQLRKIAPDFAVEKTEGINWPAAVAEADKHYGTHQPGRAAFLRKYLGKGSSEDQLKQLQIARGVSIGGAGSWGASYDIGPAGKPIGTIGAWISDGKLVEMPTLGVKNATVEKIDYSDLIFDAHDMLISADRHLPPDSEGVRIVLGENTSGTGGTNFFWVQITTAHGESETISYNPDLTIKERTVNGTGKQDYREVYDHGKLSRRTYYKTRTSAGGLQEVDHEEKFPLKS